MTPSKQLQFGVSVLSLLVCGTLLFATFAGLCGATYLPGWWLTACDVLRGIRVVPSLVLFALFVGTVGSLASACDACGFKAAKSDNG